MPRKSPNERFSVSLPPRLAELLRAEAERHYGGNLSATLAAAIDDWLTDAAVRAEGIVAMEEYEAEHGAFTEEELADAQARVAAEMGWVVTDSCSNGPKHAV